MLQPCIASVVGGCSISAPCHHVMLLLPCLCDLERVSGFTCAGFGCRQQSLSFYVLGAESAYVILTEELL